IIVLGHAFLEALDALGDVAHQAGNLAGAKQQHEHEKDKEDVPPAQSHRSSPNTLKPRCCGHYGSKARRAEAGPQAPLSLSRRIGGSLILGLENEHRAGIDADADLAAEWRGVAFLDARQ